MSTSEIITTIRNVTARMSPVEVGRMRQGAAETLTAAWGSDVRPFDYWLGCVDGAIAFPFEAVVTDAYKAGFDDYGTPAAHSQIFRRWSIVSECVKWKRVNGAWDRSAGRMIYATNRNG